MIPFTDTLLEGESIKPLAHWDKGRKVCSYYVTSFGRVARVSKTKGVKWMTLTPTTHPGGYYTQVRLPWTTANVHRLVGKLFLPDFSDDLMVCHKDETLPLTHVNRVDNLFVGTASENLRDAHNKGRKQWSNQYGCASK